MTKMSLYYARFSKKKVTAKAVRKTAEAAKPKVLLRKNTEANKEPANKTPKAAVATPPPAPTQPVQENPPKSEESTTA